MSKNLIIVTSGKKSSGKSSLAKFVISEYLNKRIGQKRFSLVKKGKETFLLDSFENNIIDTDHPNDDLKKLTDCYSCKIYSFADPLKEMCIDIFGLDVMQCYGSDDDKNTKTHISWDSMPEHIRQEYAKSKTPKSKKRYPAGYLSARELMEILGTLVFRRFDESCWSRSLYAKIKRDNHVLSVIGDCRFPNEVSMGTEIGAKVIRLLRNPFDSKSFSETALDNFPQGEYSHIIDNEKLPMSQCHNNFKKILFKWFDEHGVVCL